MDPGRCPYNYALFPEHLGKKRGKRFQAAILPRLCPSWDEKKEKRLSKMLALASPGQKKGEKRVCLNIVERGGGGGKGRKGKVTTRGRRERGRGKKGGRRKGVNLLILQSFPLTEKKEGKERIRR